MRDLGVYWLRRSLVKQRCSSVFLLGEASPEELRRLMELRWRQLLRVFVFYMQMFLCRKSSFINLLFPPHASVI